MKQKKIFLFFISLFLFGVSHADKPIRNIQSVRYVVNQTFDGQSFFKDNNVWIYNQKFAETFGMPADGIDLQLEGIEAAAFRVEDGNYKLCGMGGKTENCKQNSRYMLDIYVNEQKNPLPWATAQKADWINDYNSLLWLKLPPGPKTVGEIALENEEKSKIFRTNQGGRLGDVIDDIMPNIVTKGMFTLHPFADLKQKREVNFYIDSGTPNIGHLSSAIPIYGYKRQAINHHDACYFEI